MKIATVLFALLISIQLFGQSDTSRLRHPPELGNLYFGENIMELQEDHRTELMVVAEHLKANPKLGIIIIGHTDDIGERKSNERVAILRAKKVRDYLIVKGVDKKRITYGGQGEDFPVFRDTTDYARAMNRRVTLRYFYMDNN